MDFLEALMSNPILQTTMLAALAASISGGIVGSYVLAKRLALLAGGIAHTALGGIGFALWMQRVQGVTWFNPILGALLSSFLATLAIVWIRRYHARREDMAIAALWSVGMALGILFASQICP